MAQTLRTIVSELASDVKSFNLDDRISFRYLANKFKDKIAYFLRIESKTREIFKDYSVWVTINCVELEEVASNCCGFIDKCSTLKRTKIKIPKSYSTIYGPIIKIFTVDRSKEFKFIYSGQYKDYITRQYNTHKEVFWIEDNYIFVPNSSIDKIIVMLLPDNPIEVEILNGCKDDCLSPLDGIITYPDYLITLAKQEALKEISGIYKREIEDEKGDDNTNRKQ